MNEKTPEPLSEAQQRELRRLSEQFKRQASVRDDPSLWSLIGNLHNNEQLRWWITLESVALQPLVTKERSGEFLLHELLATPEGRHESKLNRPWAYLVWSWPSRRLVRLEAIQHWDNLPEVAFDRSHLCTPQYAALLEAALSAGAEWPPVAGEIRRFFAVLAPYFPWGAPRLTAIAQPEKRVVIRQGTLLPDRQWETALRRLGEEIRQLLRKTGRMPALRAVDRLLDRLDSASFSVAVVGEFGRGKSTLINELVGRNCLGTGRMPSGMMLVRVFPAAEDVLIVKRPGQPAMQQPFVEGSLESLQGNADEGQLLVAELGILSPWLHQTGMQFYDTPGANSGQPEHLAPSMEVLATADAAIMTVSAVAPLGISEREFLAQHVAAHSLPRIAVAITHLDQIPESERASVMAYSAAHLEKWDPKAVLGTTLSRDALSPDISVTFAGIAELKTLLGQWANDSGHRALIDRQIREGMQKVVAEAMAQLGARQKTLSLSAQERTELREKADVASEHIRLAWDDVKLELCKRQLATGDLLETGLMNHKADLVDRLNYELRSRPEPAVWWREDFPFRLRQEFGQLGKTVQKTLDDRIAEDFRWVQGQAKTIYSQNLPAAAFDARVQLEIPAELSGKEPADLYHARQYTRLAVGGLAIGAFALLGPLASVVSLGGGVFSEGYFRRRLAVQRQELAGQVARVVDDLLRKAAHMVRARVEVLYTDVATRLQTEGQGWQEIARRTLLEPQQGRVEEENNRLNEELKCWIDLAAKLKTPA